MKKKKPNIKDLSREEKLEMLTLLEEKEKRKREKPDNYVPNEGQIDVHASGARVRAVFAGNGGGKTALAVNEALWALRGYSPVRKEYTRVPCRVIVVLDKPDKVDSTWLPELRKWYNFNPDKQFHKRGKPYVSQITMDNGSELIFMFHDQDPMTFESVEVDKVIFDEPPPRHVYIALRRGGRKKDSNPQYLIIGTPITGSWLRKEIYEPWSRGELPSTDCFKFGTAVNEHNLADGYIQDFSSVLSDKEKRIRLHGEFFDLEGLALAHLWDRDIHIIDPPDWNPNWPVVIGIDPHPNKAHIACMIGCDPNNNYYYLSELTSERRDTPRVYAEKLRNWYRGYRVAEIVCDSLGSGPLTGGEGNKSFIEVLNEVGVRARATTWEDKKEESWIMRIQETLLIPEDADNFGQRTPKLRVVRGNNGIIENIESVQWLKYRNMDEYKPSLDISNKDYLAALKYALAANLHFGLGDVRVHRNTKAVYGIKPRRN